MIVAVTGASRGLGAALALALAEGGHALVLGARTAGALAPVAERALALGAPAVHLVPGDVALPETQAAWGRAAGEAGPLDALVNNAAILGPTPLPGLLDYPVDALARVLAVNVLAPLAIAQAVWPHLKPDGCLVNVSSDAAPVSYAGWGGYGLSKAALDHMSGTLAAEHPDRRVYWVDPGEMRTDMFREHMPHEDLGYLYPPERAVPGILALLRGRSPSGRYLAQPD